MKKSINQLTNQKKPIKPIKPPLIKRFIFLFILIFPSSLFVNAQALVNADGSVKLADDLNISLNGEVYPDATNTAYLGIYGQQFYEIRGQTHYSNGDVVTSDLRLKENFRPIDQPLEKLLLLTGKKYDFIADSSDSLGTEKEQAHKANLKKDRLGLFAQDVQQILPEAVVYDSETDQYYIDYYAILTLSIEAFKEQQNKLQQLSAQLESLKKQ